MALAIDQSGAGGGMQRVNDRPDVLVYKNRSPRTKKQLRLPYKLHLAIVFLRSVNVIKPPTVCLCLFEAMTV